ncbi:MAG: MBL fold metallo-hydrolase [Clostridiales bacterium]
MKDLMIECISSGMLDSNVYLVKYKSNILVIDGGAPFEDIKKYIDSNSKVKQIILTHAHVDHIFYVDEYKKITGADIYMSESDFELAKNPNFNCSSMMGYNLVINSEIIKLKGAEKLEFGDLKIEIINTPGHTPGGISIKINEYLFTGDTLFNGGIGRTDLYKGDPEILIDSIKNKIFTLDENMIILPGHGLQSTIRDEKARIKYFE